MKAQGKPPQLIERRRRGPGKCIAPAIVPCKGTTGNDRDLVIPFQGMGMGFNRITQGRAPYALRAPVANPGLPCCAPLGHGKWIGLACLRIYRRR